MAIKRRERPALDSAAIDSFGEAADTPPERQTPSRTAAAALPSAPATDASASSPQTPLPPSIGRQPKAATVRANDWPDDLSKTFLLRYPDPAIPKEIAELAELIGRNKHQTTLLALRRGIDALRREAEEFGDSAELIK